MTKRDVRHRPDKWHNGAMIIKGEELEVGEKYTYLRQLVIDNNQSKEYARRNGTESFKLARYFGMNFRAAQTVSITRPKVTSII